MSNPVIRVRVMDVNIKDSDDDDFLTLRILVDDDSKSFYYIPVSTQDMGDRSISSICLISSFCLKSIFDTKPTKSGK